MGRTVTALSEMKVGGSGVLERLELPDEVSDHLAHLGFLAVFSLEVLRRAPAGDPTVYRIDGVEVGLRNEAARHILIEPAASAEGPVRTPSRGAAMLP